MMNVRSVSIALCLVASSPGFLLSILQDRLLRAASAPTLYAGKAVLAVAICLYLSYALQLPGHLLLFLSEL